MPHLEGNASITDLSQTVVCILAHNEEANIEETLITIIEGNRDTQPVIRVYANGCTDHTHSIVRDVSARHPSVELVIIEQASKTNAWNTAFQQNNNQILIFSDGDILPEPGSVADIVTALEEFPRIEIASCSMWPASNGLTMQQRITGFMLIPLKQDFLAGGFYGIRRSAFVSHFQRLGLSGLPDGVTGEDAFLDTLVGRDSFTCVDSRVFFQPPDFSDYYKYLARLKWQDEQLQHYYSIDNQEHSAYFIARLLGKVTHRNKTNNSVLRLLIGGGAALTRSAFIKINKSRIEKEYRKLGPVTADGRWVLQKATRSTSVK